MSKIRGLYFAIILRDREDSGFNISVVKAKSFRKKANVRSLLKRNELNSFHVKLFLLLALFPIRQPHRRHFLRTPACRRFSGISFFYREIIALLNSLLIRQNANFLFYFFPFAIE